MSAVCVSYKQKQADYVDLVNKLANDAKAIVCAQVRAGCSPILYLAGIRRSGADTLNPHLKLWADLQWKAPYDIDQNGLETVWPHSLPMALPYYRYFEWIDERLKRVNLEILAD